LQRALIGSFSNYLRTWDYASAARVDRFVANSWNVRRRIWRTWRRRAQVVHPPVAIDSFRHERAEDYFLMVGELVAYKQLNYAVRTFARNGRRLKIVGDGPEYANLKKLAAPNIEFCGRVSDEELRELYARSSALIVPGEEDFGITTVESLASGKPVIAFGRGGSVEIVRERCGVLYDEATEAGLSDALRMFDRTESWFNPLYLRTSVDRFSEDEFNSKFAFAVNKLTGRRTIDVEPAPEFTTCLQTHHDTRSARPI
jgi:glycosyltransferase involved in cell wall biosynthesis